MSFSRFGRISANKTDCKITQKYANGKNKRGKIAIFAQFK